MDKHEAARIIRDTFQKPFDRERYSRFTRNLVSVLDEGVNAQFKYQGNLIPDSFTPYIQSLERVGKYYSPDNKKVDVLIAQLKKGPSLERARTMQRNFIAWYLRSRDDKDAALVAFVSPDHSEWRFSLVKLEYELGLTPKGKVKPQMELTPARRWSFLVGEYESTHTAQARLVPILQSDSKPTMSDLEEAFNIEIVSREFFTQYRELFNNVNEELELILRRNKHVADEFIKNKIETSNFTKKLLGQIVFLYFLQKKGWFGVERDSVWGSGPHNFLRQLFCKELVPYNNFFNEILEPLFYEALALERPEDFYSRFNCKIPFLNGGLFDPLNGYDWVHTDIDLPNHLFSNCTKTDAGDTGTGILDVFDRYNFTVSEDEPLEKEVAIDPEMLGKVFENLLEVKDRKSKGTYYTPREIVHYMCQESLINYIDAAVNTGDVSMGKEKPTNLKLFGAPAFQQQALKIEGTVCCVPREDIEEFIRHGEMAIENDMRVEIRGKETERYFYQVPLAIRQNASTIDEKLASIRVCDPAVGSGAFPVGMMTEIVRARRVLNSYLSDPARSNYTLKRHTIQTCIYGVDVDPGAIEVAKLRLWLSLVVDEDNYELIQPLPNLDYKIVCGDSLNEVEKRLEKWQLLEQLEGLKPQHFAETNSKKKKALKETIDHIIYELTDGYNVFDFHIYFSEVFHENKGFNIVIANPPYISHDKINNKRYLQQHFRCYEPFADLYCYFIELAINLVCPGGVVCFITSNSYIKAKYGAPLRASLRRQSYLLELIDVEDYQIFESAIVNTAVLLAQKRGSREGFQCLVVNAHHDGSEFSKFIRNNTEYYEQEDFRAEPWSLASRNELDLARKLERTGKTLEQCNTKIRLGIATGANEAFLLNAAKRAELIKQDPNNSQIIKPVIRGRDIYRYGFHSSNQYLLLTKNGINVRHSYPTVYKYLDSFNNDFKSRGAQGDHWSNLRNCAFYEDFKEEKIIWIELTDRARFALCDTEMYLLNSAYFLLPPPQTPARYLLGILNSKVIQFYLKMIAQTSGMGVTRWINEYVKKFPVPEAHNPICNEIIAKVANVLEITQNSDYLGQGNSQSRVLELENQIDRLVYDLYGLTSEEIKIVEGAD